jgi:hypothetical protein
MIETIKLPTVWLLRLLRLLRLLGLRLGLRLRLLLSLRLLLCLHCGTIVNIACHAEGSRSSALSQSQLTRAFGHQWLPKGCQDDAHADHGRESVLFDLGNAILAINFLIFLWCLRCKDDRLTFVEDSFAQLE